MVIRKRRVKLHPEGGIVRFLKHLFVKERDLLIEPAVLGVDYSLRHRAAVHAVRSFIDAVDHYSLQSSRVVQVISDYAIPVDTGLEKKVPEWIAHRLRFGVVTADQSIRYVAIRQVDFRWDRRGTELLISLEERVAPGTRAFIAAYLGRGDGVSQVDELPRAVVLEEQGSG
ncbi:MAG: hypothetical protein CMP23_13625 [Rickettsiales bacterium]|nr:hypothetical protein [Rickettsiales bacterium]